MRAAARLRRKKSRMRLLSSRAPPGWALFDEITPECKRVHRASARHPFQYYYRRFGGEFCVCSQTLLPGGVKPAGAATGCRGILPWVGEVAGAKRRSMGASCSHQRHPDPSDSAIESGRSVVMPLFACWRRPTERRLNNADAHLLYARTSAGRAADSQKRVMLWGGAWCWR